MKLSEVINNNDDLYKHVEFKNGKFKAVRNSDSINVMFEFGGKEMGVYVPLEGWEEVKPPRQWSEKELMLFKLLPDWAKWISRDLDDGSVFVFSDEPLKNRMVFKSVVGQSDFLTTKGTIVDDILTITFEESPVYIGDLKGE